MIDLCNGHVSDLGAHGPFRDDLEAPARKVTRQTRAGCLAWQLPVQEIVAIFRVLVNLHQFHQKLPDGILLQAVDAAISILVRQDESQSRVKVIADFLSPSGDEPLDDVPPLLLRR
jgi:hypothetical protein